MVREKAGTACYDPQAVSQPQRQLSDARTMQPGFVRRLGLALLNPRFQVIALGWAVLVTAVVFLPDPAGFAVDTHIYAGAYRNMAAGLPAYGVPYAMTADPTGQQTIQYFSTPAAAVVGGWIGALPSGDVSWLLVNLVATLAAFAMLLHLVRPSLGGRLSVSLLMGGLAVVLLFQPDIQQLVYGNQESLTLLGVTIAVYGLRRGSPAATGSGIAFAAVLKAWPALLLLPFVAQRRWREVGWAVACAGVLLALTLPVVGIRPWLELATRILDGGLGSLAQGGYNMAPLATLLPGVPSIAWVAMTCVAVAAAGLLPLSRAVPASMSAFILFWPVVWMHDGVILLAGLVLLYLVDRRLAPTLLLAYVLFAVRVPIVWLPAALLLLATSAVPDRVLQAQASVRRILAGPYEVRRERETRAVESAGGS